MCDGRPRPSPLGQVHDAWGPLPLGDASARDVVAVRNTFLEAVACTTPRSADRWLRAERGLATAPAALHAFGAIQISLAAATEGHPSQESPPRPAAASKLRESATPFTPSTACEGPLTPTTACATPSTPSREARWPAPSPEAAAWGAVPPLLAWPQGCQLAHPPVPGHAFAAPPCLPPPAPAAPAPARAPACRRSSEESRRASWADLFDEETHEEDGGIAKELVLQVARPHACSGGGGGPMSGSQPASAIATCAAGAPLSFPPPAPRAAPPAVPPPPEPPKLPPGFLPVAPVSAPPPPAAVSCQQPLAHSVEQILACVANATPKFAPPSLPAPWAEAAAPVAAWDEAAAFFGAAPALQPPQFGGLPAPAPYWDRHQMHHLWVPV